MDIKDAVELALNKKEEGFTYLYESTYQDKYYLALKFMHDPAQAQDVLQVAYERAFRKLDTLENPELFSSWLSRIVANTAKNALAKNKPLLFTDLQEDDDIEYEVEDPSDQYQPNRAYSKKEIQELVQSLLSALSDEQRLCMLMFYLDGQSIKEIASTFNCSENTIKSRLHYGRLELKKEVEKLEKQGYKFYSVAPIPLLLFLLHQEASWIQPPVINPPHLSRQSFIHGLTGKITTTLLAISIAGAGFVAVNHFTKEKANHPSSLVQTMDDQELIAQDLSKTEMEFVLAYGPDDTQALDLPAFCTHARKMEIPLLESKGIDQHYQLIYETKDINRLLNLYSQQMIDEALQPYLKEDGYHLPDVSSSFYKEATIINQSFNHDKLIIDYDLYYFHQSTSEDRRENVKFLRAILEKQEDGYYHITSIEKRIEENKNNDLDAYTMVLNAYANKKPGHILNYKFPEIDYGYCLYDLNHDGIEELLLRATNESSSEIILVFTVKENKTGYDIICLKEFTLGQSGSFISSILKPSDNHNIYYTEFSRGTGKVNVYRMNIEKDQLVRPKKQEHQFIFGTEEYQQFTKENKAFEYVDIHNHELLKSLEK